MAKVRGEAQMMQAMAAVEQEQRIKPAFTVRKLPGQYPKTVHLFDKEKNKIVSKTTMEDRGFLVTCARGHSLHALTMEHLREIGVGLRLIPLIDTETGEVKGVMDNSIADLIEEEIDA